MQLKEFFHVPSSPAGYCQIRKIGVEGLEDGCIGVEFRDALVRRPLVETLHGRWIFCGYEVGAYMLAQDA